MLTLNSRVYFINERFIILDLDNTPSILYKVTENDEVQKEASKVLERILKEAKV